MGLTASSNEDRREDSPPTSGAAPASSSSYKYADRKVPYRSERLEITPEELKTLKERQSASVSVSVPTTTTATATAIASDGAVDSSVMPDWFTESSKPCMLLVDTDLGTDIDDSLALLFLLHLPVDDVKILGITTVYGHTRVRAAVCRAIVKAREARTGQPSGITVVSGEGVPIGTHRDVWHTGTEGMTDGMCLLSQAEVDELMSPTRTETEEMTGAQFIVEQVRKYPGSVTIACIGALTNLAKALEIEPQLPSLVHHVVYMGQGHRLKPSDIAKCVEKPFPIPEENVPLSASGSVFHYFPNHNISGDTLACVKVFASGMKISVVNDTVTNGNWFTGPPCELLLEMGAAVKAKADGGGKAPLEDERAIVGLLLNTWLKFRSSILGRPITGTCPHDPLTISEAVYPGKFVKYSRGHLLVHEWAGYSTFIPNPTGPHLVAESLPNREEFITFISTVMTSYYVPQRVKNVL
ncbi:purine nucleosidase [Pelomyxa schiedti]|nr:purine nucleosidase [Pelomyxa schiedti]